MDDPDLLVRRFQADRGRLAALAYRMLGSRTEAEDAVQEAWLRLSRAGSRGIENLGAWLTTVVARVCLDILRSRRSHREEPMDAEVAERMTSLRAAGDPERDAVLADSVGLALLVVLDRLAPAERSPSCSTICSIFPSRRSRPSWGARWRRPGSSPAGHDDG